MEDEEAVIEIAGKRFLPSSVWCFMNFINPFRILPLSIYSLNFDTFITEITIKAQPYAAHFLSPVRRVLFI